MKCNVTCYERGVQEKLEAARKSRLKRVYGSRKKGATEVRVDERRM